MREFFGKIKGIFLSDLTLKFLIFLLIPFTVVIMFPSPYGIDYKYEIGSVWLYDDVVAPFSFPIYKSEEQYQEEINKVYSQVYFIFDVDTTVVEKQKKEFEAFITDLKSYLDIKKFKHVSARDSVEIERLRVKLLNKISADEIERIEYLNRVGYFDVGKFKITGETYLSLIYSSAGVISIPRTSLRRNEIVLRKGRFEEIYRQGKFYDLGECLEVAKELSKRNFGEIALVDTGAFDLMSKILFSFVKPNLIFNQGETEELLEREKGKILKTVGIVRENEKIISRHEIVTPEAYLKLESLKKAQKERGIGAGKILKDLGRFVFTGSVLAIFWLYIYMYRKKIYFDNKLLLLIDALFLFQILVAFLITKIKVGNEVNYFVLVPSSSMLLTIIFDSRVAFWGTVAISLIVGSAVGYNYDVTSASLIAGTIAIYSVRNIGNRMQIFRSFIFILIAYVFVIASFSLQKYESFSNILAKFGFAGANALLSPIITYGLLIFFERIFGIMTEITLLELSDFNHPLLRELSARAPGTFHHSIAVATLAEAAAKAIGANPILARVGAYYHDIGKILNPEFFVENQMESEKLHTSITPEQSVQIIISHVEDGQELAKKYKLPSEIIKFIPMHHGTTLVAYFYGKALKRRELKNVEIKESDFRYKGPKPDSKETAIVMLADSVEAATRSLDEKTPENIEKIVDAIFENRIEDGQLDESNLTLKDIEEIKKAFVQILVNLYHPRIKYPGQEKERTKDKVSENEKTRQRKSRKVK